MISTAHYTITDLYDGVDGASLYTWVRYADDAAGAGISDSPTGKKYMGVAINKSTATESNVPGDYIWSLIQGPQGTQGVQGPAGTSQYVHIRYSANADGSAFTTTPQVNTAYIGLANTTSATAPILNTGYTWSSFKGPQGNTGIQGPTGGNGQTYWTWVKYADDAVGTGMSDTPSGKRYIGLAPNKTTATESSVTTDYQWSPLYDNVEVGGRNIYLDSYLKRCVSYTSVSTLTRTDSLISSMSNLVKVTHNGVAGDSVNFGFRHDTSDQRISFTTGSKYVLTFKARGNVTNMSYTYFMRAAAEGGNSGTGSNPVTLDATIWKPVTIYKDGPFDTSTGYLLIGSTDGGAGKWFEVKDVMLEQANIPTDWTANQEDIQAQIDSKAETSDVEALALILSQVSAEVNAKAGMGEFEALETAYNARVAQDIIDKNKLTSDLATIEGRTALVETIAGNSKIVTEFINTVITESEEGIFIANGSTSTGILISDTRISFIDNNTEVAYISNQTMQINHGIFVQSATISDFKFEKIPGTTILGITWVGV